MDKLLAMVFEPERWEIGIQHGADKDIPIPILREMCSVEVRVNLCTLISKGMYRISAPHTAQIPKDTPGEYRTVYVNEPVDRVLLNVINDCLCEVGSDMVHPSCKSYQKHISCGDAVLSVSKAMSNKSGVIGWKSDYSKYFDRVKIESIDGAFDEFEKRHGESVIIDLLRSYYHDDTYLEFDKDKHEWIPLHKYQSLKQGCAVASWLANVIMYEQDAILSKMADAYCRYSDDTYFIGARHKEAMEKMKAIADKHGVSINPKKVEDITNRYWVKFLGFSLKGNKRSISHTGLDRLKKEIEHATLRNKNCNTAQKAMTAIYKILYKGANENSYSWGCRMLRYINEDADLLTLDNWLKDIIRACALNRRHIGGIGFRREQKVGVIHRGTGKNVRTNMERMPVIEGYTTLICMANALRTSNDAYDSLIRTKM